MKILKKKKNLESKERRKKVSGRKERKKEKRKEVKKGKKKKKRISKNIDSSSFLIFKQLPHMSRISVIKMIWVQASPGAYFYFIFEMFTAGDKMTE